MRLAPRPLASASTAAKRSAAFQRLVGTAACAVLLAAPLLAQQREGDAAPRAPESGAAEESRPAAGPDHAAGEQSVPARIIDEQEAREAKQRQWREQNALRRKIVKAPFHAIGRLAGGLETRRVLKTRTHLDLEHRRRQGFAPLLGGFTVGSGPAAGVQYFREMPGLRLEIPARVSTNLYTLAGVKLLVNPRGRFGVNLGGTHTTRPRDDFFGLGNDSSEGLRTNYNLQARYATVQPVVRFSEKTNAFLEARVSHVNIFEGDDELYPDTVRVFSPGAVPGLRGARWISLGAGLEHDTRDSKGLPGRGGFHGIRASWNDGLAGEDFGYWKYQLEVSRFLRLWSRGRVLALRVLGESNQARGGSAVPFFDQVILGGPSMRGFREFRFYGLTGVLATAEYRWLLTDYLAAFVFLDEGQVGREVGDLGWRRFHTSYGVGLRLGTQATSLGSVSIGHSAEGFRVYLAVAPRF